MKVQLAQQVQELVGKSELVIITERVDDVALLIGQMIKMGLPEVLDRHIPRHWKQRGLSWGWTAVIWLAYILTEGDHRKVSVEAYIKGMHKGKSNDVVGLTGCEFSVAQMLLVLAKVEGNSGIREGVVSTMQRTPWHSMAHDAGDRRVS